MEPRTRRRAASSILAPASLIPAIWQSAIKLNPRVMIRRQVMFVVEIVAALATIIFVRDLVTGGAHLGFTAQIFVWLWLTVLFANFAETVAKGRGKAQAAMPRWAGTEMMAKRLPRADATNFETVPTARLRPRDVVLVEVDDLIPSDGDVIEGIASVDESAITGEVRAGHPRNPAATARPSPAARASCRAGSRCASSRRRDPLSSIA